LDVDTRSRKGWANKGHVYRSFDVGLVSQLWCAQKKDAVTKEPYLVPRRTAKHFFVAFGIYF
jgi:hypothetical protein